MASLATDILNLDEKKIAENSGVVLPYLKLGLLFYGRGRVIIFAGLEFPDISKDLHIFINNEDSFSQHNCLSL